ncbi:hypothetical protein FRB97_003384 [Tulasnella sp. 331]|nr:hypothetical protein FRB97_003384 [Tulasnella sp. 331]
MSLRKRQTTSSTETVAQTATSPPTNVGFDVDRPIPIITRTLSGRQSKILERRARFLKAKAKASQPFWRSPTFQVMMTLSTILLMYLSYQVSNGLNQRVVSAGKGRSAVKKQPVPVKVSKPPTPQTTSIRYGEEPKKKVDADVFAAEMMNNIVVRDVEGKGKGTIALRDLVRGDRILVDEPILTITRDASDAAVESIITQIGNMTDSNLSAFFSLYYPSTVLMADGTQKPINPEEIDMPLAIVQANSLAIEGGMQAVFPKAARINHGCSAAFNAVHSWRADEKKLYVHALRDIKAGEEILISYLDTKRPRSDRQSILSMHYHFDCTCSVCSLPESKAAKSDRLLLRMHHLYSKLQTWTEDEIDGVEAIDVINEIWETGEEERRTQLASNAGLVATAHSDVESAKAWYMLAAQTAVYELGAGSHRVLELVNLAGATDSTAYPSWAAKESMTVGGPRSGFGLSDAAALAKVREESREGEAV